MIPTVFEKNETNNFISSYTYIHTYMHAYERFYRCCAALVSWLICLLRFALVIVFPCMFVRSVCCVSVHGFRCIWSPNCPKYLTSDLFAAISPSPSCNVEKYVVSATKENRKLNRRMFTQSTLHEGGRVRDNCVTESEVKYLGLLRDVKTCV